MQKSVTQTRPVPPPTLMPYRVRVLGRVRDNPEHRSPGTWHEDAMLLVFLSGRGSYRLGSQRYSIRAPALGIVLPEAPRGMLMADSEEPYDKIFCRFGGDLALHTARRILAGRSSKIPFWRPADWDSIVQTALSLVAHSRRVRGDGSEHMRPADAELAKLLAILDVGDNEEEKSLTVESIQNYIRGRIYAPAELQDMADYFSVSRAYLCRKVKSLTGCTPIKLLNQEKMARASELLRRGGFSVSEVAACIGFSETNYFSKVYKKYFGCPPTSEKAEF